MDQITPENLFMLLGLTLLLGALSMAYDGRHHIARWWWSVRPARRDYVQPPDPVPAQVGAQGGACAQGGATGNDASNGIATGSNGRNEELLCNERLQAQADIIAQLLQADSLYIPDGKGGYKKLGQTALIKLATGLSPNGRPESEYGQLRAQLEDRLQPSMTVTEGDQVRTIAK